jgi:inhibitor of nuclear factor kappa-B kinase subunit alpha
MRHKLQLWPYHLQVKQQLEPGDPKARMDFGAWFLDNMLDSLESVLWTDEAYFNLQGEVHTRNAIIWAKEKPSIVATAPLHPTKLCMWIGFTAHFILPPFFFDSGTVTGQRYRQMLEQHVIPYLKHHHKFSSTIFMQDGASPHIEHSVKELLQHSFGEERIISRNFPHPWPARSPDLNPSDYYLWGHLKSKVFSGHFPTNTDQLKARIISCVEEISESDSLQNSVLHLLDRLQFVLNVHGIHIEQML